ncbi:MAG: HAD family hydrolase [Candidatus Obscuribacterales bacterium]|nr:HAD family hydrolase [Candidatus Obscuribacterales bacterium]
MLLFTDSPAQKRQKMDNPTVKLSKSDLLAAPQIDFSDSGLFEREAHVLSTGLRNGLTKGIKHSINDLSDFGSAFAKNPLSATGDLIEKHWSEAAVAATISFAAPRKWANTLLTLASTRGVALATAESMALAAKPGLDLNKITDYYSNSIASETHALLNALPATLAGGAVGKMTANGVFGKNLGAYDLASGKLKFSDIKSNLWEMHDKILPPKARLAVMDLDATLVSTNKHMAVGLEAGMKKVAENTGLPEAEVKSLFGEQYGKLQSFAHPWTVELAMAERLKVGQPGAMTFEQFRAQVSDPYWSAIKDAAKENLHVYDGVHSTIAELNKQGIKVVLFSNSPGSAVLPRMAMHGLEAPMKNILALKNISAPEGLAPELLAAGKERMASQLSGSGAEKLILVPRELKKPNPTALDNLIRQENLRPSQVMMIGDSLASDMGIAQNTGARGLWARYSEIHKPYDATLNQVTSGNYKGEAIPEAKPRFEAELHQFSDILKKLKPERDLRGLATKVGGLPGWQVPLQSYGLLGHDK